uniref:U13-Theraphotoxin-Ct1c_1 n=1 Tax=Coremiocnemis tropix TaxID=1904443 RepID=A0A482ZGP8_CORTR
MKTSILFVIFGLALLFALSAATEMEETDRECGYFWWKCPHSLSVSSISVAADMEETDRECGYFWWKCGEGKPPCCTGYSCKIGLYLCIWSP